MFFEGRVFCFKLCDQGVLIGQTAFLFDCNIKTCIFFLFSHLVDVKQKKETLGKKRNCLEFNFHFRPDRKMLWQKRPRKNKPIDIPTFAAEEVQAFLFFFQRIFLTICEEWNLHISFLMSRKKMPQGYIVGWAQKVRTLLFFKGYQEFLIEAQNSKNIDINSFSKQYFRFKLITSLMVWIIQSIQDLQNTDCKLPNKFST